MKTGKRWLIALLAAVLQLALIAGIVAGVKSGRKRYADDGYLVELRGCFVDFRDGNEVEIWHGDLGGDGEYCAVYQTGEGGYNFVRSETEPKDAVWFRIKDSYPEFSVYTDARLAVDRVYAVYNPDEPGVRYDRIERSLTAQYREATAIAYVYKHKLYIDSVTIDGMTADSYVEYLNGFVTR